MSDPFYQHSENNTGGSAGEGEYLPIEKRIPVYDRTWERILIRSGSFTRPRIPDHIPVHTAAVVGQIARNPLALGIPFLVSPSLSGEFAQALVRGSARAMTGLAVESSFLKKSILEEAHKILYEINFDTALCSSGEIDQGEAFAVSLAPDLLIDESRATLSSASDHLVLDRLVHAVALVREQADGKPVGVRVEAGNLDQDVRLALETKPDFIVLDCMPPIQTYMSRQIISTNPVPVAYAVCKTASILRSATKDPVSIALKADLRTSLECAKALALGADVLILAVTPVTAVQNANTLDEGAEKLKKYLYRMTEEMTIIARASGNSDIQELSLGDLCTMEESLSLALGIEYLCR